MKKILGIVAVALIVGAPALAQNASTMTYHLQLNGTPSVTPGAQYDTSTATEATYNMAHAVDLLNWSARLEVGGTIDGNLVGGAANVVVDIALKKDGVLVTGGLNDTDGGFGITTATGEAGFYSVVMDDTEGAFAQQPAAFPWVFNTWYDPDQNAGADITPAPPYGRLIDTVPANGPNMAQFTYPSTFKYYRPAGAAAANTTTVTAASGTLMGMGAGYTDFNFTPDAPERGGVGLTADTPQQCYGCQEGFWCMDLAGRPIIEGQINMKGLPPGTYTLELTAGTGNNVLLPTIACNPYTGGTSGAFAAAAGTTTGDTITFVYDPDIALAEPPVIQPGVASVKVQGGVAYGVPFIGETVTTNPGGTTAVTVECRAGGVTQIALPFDVAVEAADGTIDGNEIVVTGGTVTTLDTTTPGLILVNMTTANQNGSCVKVTVSGLRKLGGGKVMPAAVTKSIVALRGDVTGNAAVDIGDVNAVKAASGALLNSSAVAFRRDVTANGAIDIGDVNNVKSLSGNALVGTCP